jgi:hypothetical protein
LSLQAEARLVRVEAATGLDVGSHVPDREGEGQANLFLAVADGPQTQFDPEALAEHLGDVAVAEVELARQPADEGGETNPKGAVADALGEGALGGGAAAITVQGVALVLDDERFDLRELGDLVALRGRVVARQRQAAAGTDVRFAGDDLVGVVDEGASGALVAFLPALGASRGRLLGGWLVAGSVRRRGLVGVGGVLLEASKGLVELSLENSDLGFEESLLLGHLGAERGQKGERFFEGGRLLRHAPGEADPEGGRQDQNEGALRLGSGRHTVNGYNSSLSLIHI